MFCMEYYRKIDKKQNLNLSAVDLINSESLMVIGSLYLLPLSNLFVYLLQDEMKVGESRVEITPKCQVFRYVYFAFFNIVNFMMVAFMVQEVMY